MLEKKKRNCGVSEWKSRKIRGAVNQTKENSDDEEANSQPFPSPLLVFFLRRRLLPLPLLSAATAAFSSVSVLSITLILILLPDSVFFLPAFPCTALSNPPSSYTPWVSLSLSLSLSLFLSGPSHPPFFLILFLGFPFPIMITLVRFDHSSSALLSLSPLFFPFQSLSLFS